MTTQTIKIKLTESTPIKIKTEGINWSQGIWDIDTIRNYIVLEEPTKITSKRFQTSHPYVSGLLKVFYNGLKEINIVEISDTEFELPIDSITDDTVEVEYFKQS